MLNVIRNLIELSVPDLEHAERYHNMFRATLDALKKESIRLFQEHGSSISKLYDINKTKAPPAIHPYWVSRLISCDPELLTTRALMDVPSKTQSILGDPDLSAENFAVKFRRLPKISATASEFHSGEYINIASRLWNTASPDGIFTAGQTQDKAYKGATGAQETGSRIQKHRSILRMSLSAARKKLTSKQRPRLSRHYEFGCQADPDETGFHAYESRRDFRSLGHIDAHDPKNMVWAWLREIVNQIILYMLPPPGTSSFHN